MHGSYREATNFQGLLIKRSDKELLGGGEVGGDHKVARAPDAGTRPLGGVAGGAVALGGGEGEELLGILRLRSDTSREQPELIRGVCTDRDVAVVHHAMQ